VDVSLVESPKAGDYLIIHAGYAIQVLDLEEAEERLRLFAELAEKQGLDPEGSS
jgi:hydrogenase expression/formation protein HypC